MLGLMLNLSFAATLIQPDWALSLLLGALLAHRGYWPWVFVGIAIHDLVLHWSPLATLPWVMLTPLGMIWSDAQAGASLVQRFVILGCFSIVLWACGWLPEAILLTLLLTTVVWHLMAQKYVRSA